MNRLRKTNPIALPALIGFALMAFFILRDMGLAPGTNGSVVQATTARAAAAVPASFDEVSQQLMGEHRALEAAQLGESSVSHLKALYLDCVRSTSTYRMDVDEAGYCQAVADALVHRHFDGSLDRLLAWWRAQPAQEHAIAANDGT